MTLDTALRMTEICTGLALLQASAEHVFGTRDARALFACRAVFAACLAAGFMPACAGLGLLGCGMLMLRRYDGPYNGGSDRMALLVLICVTLAEACPVPRGRELAFGYLAVQVLLSYAMSGWVKVVNPAWRNGEALVDVFAYSAYPASERLRGWQHHPRLLRTMGWGVMGFELLMPLALVDARVLTLGLCIAGSFHLANACLFGLNRFFWIWLSAYPSLWWLQARIAP